MQLGALEDLVHGVARAVHRHPDQVELAGGNGLHGGPVAGLVTDLLADVRGRPAGRPLFSRPVAEDTGLAAVLSGLHTVLTGTSTPLEQHEHLAGAVSRLTRHAVFRDRGTGSAGHVTSASAARAAARMRDLLHDEYARPLTADDLAGAAGCSQYAAYRAFSATFGLAPSDYQRQVRLREARRLLGPACHWPKPPPGLASPTRRT